MRLIREPAVERDSERDLLVINISSRARAILPRRTNAWGDWPVLALKALLN